MKGKLVTEVCRKGLVPLLTKEKQNCQWCSLLQERLQGKHLKKNNLFIPAFLLFFCSVFF